MTIQHHTLQERENIDDTSTHCSFVPAVGERPGYNFGFSGSGFDGKFEYRVGSVGSGRNIELRGLTRGSNRELYLEIAGT